LDDPLGPEGLVGRPRRYPWGSTTIVALLAATAVLGGALVVRERRAADPIVPLGLLRKPEVAIASAGMFLATASLFAITLFVRLFLQATTTFRGGAT
jgi:predicted MFS family arabinose efflux permease